MRAIDLMRDQEVAAVGPMLRRVYLAACGEAQRLVDKCETRDVFDCAKRLNTAGGAVPEVVFDELSELLGREP